MAITVSNYYTGNFNRLQDFRDALRQFDGIDGDRLAHTIMKDLFRQHGMDNIFGLSLLHKHGDLKDNEQLTDIRGTSTPLDFSLGLPAIWGFSNRLDELQPLEFSIDSKPVDWKSQSIQEFLAAFRECVVQTKSQQVFGLCLYPGDGYPGRVEFSSGRSNINLTPSEAEELPTSATREAAWFFTDDYIKRGCKCNCFSQKDHTHSHGYTT